MSQQIESKIATDAKDGGDSDWTETKTGQGVISRYRVWSKSSDGSDANIKETEASGPPYTTQVWVPVGNSGRAPPGISSFNVSYAPWYSPYKYRITFRNTDKYDFFFYDATGDYYECNTYALGTHNVDYDSSNPTIVKVQGN